MVRGHMLADSLDDLHQRAAAIGMDRNWFQPLSFPHYDVSLSRRARAVQLGAIEVDRREGYEIRKRIRAAFTDDDIQHLRAALPTYDARHAKLRRRSEEHTSELQSLMRTSYAVFCLK